MAAGLGFCKSVAGDARVKWHCSGASTSGARSFCLDPGERHRERQRELWQDLFSSPLDWWDNRLDKRSFWHPDFRHKRTRQALWLNDQHKPKWVDARLATLDSQLQRGLSGGAGSVAVGSPGPSNGFEELCEGGQLDTALDVLVLMDQQGTVPSVSMYRSLLKACAKRKALAQAKQVQAHLAKHRLECTGVFGEYLVNVLVKCGGLEDAVQVFQSLPHRTVFSWTAIISGYTTEGQGREALRVYQRMRGEGLNPDNYTLVSLLRACASLSDLEEGKRIHAEASRNGCASDLFVGSSLVSMYAKCGSMVDAQAVFDGLSERDVVSWNAMLAAYAQQGQPGKAVQLYEQMQEQGVTPNDRTFVSALQSCGMLAEKEEGVTVNGLSTKVEALEMGKAIHVDAQRKGSDLDVFVGNTLISMYGKCGSVVDAKNVFDRLSQRNMVSWNAMLATYAQQGEAEKALRLYENMQEEGGNPDIRALVSALQACGMLAEKEENSVVSGQSIKGESLEKGKAIHADSWRKGCNSDVFVGNTLISMYSKCGSIVDAQSAFDGLSQPNVVSWNAMLVAYAEEGHTGRVLELYEEMLEQGISPDEWTFVSALQVCGMLADKEECVAVSGLGMKGNSLGKGKAVHADVLMKGYDSDVFVGNTLVSMYGKCGSLLDIVNVFDGLHERTVVAWTALLSAYVEQGHGDTALELYAQMQEEGVRPDEISLLCILQACSGTGSLDMCRQIHRDLISTRSMTRVLGNTLIHAYGRCASMAEAQTVFDSLPQPDVISWNALIAGYAREGKSAKSLECYEQMQLANTKPNAVTFLSLLSACSHSGSVDKGVEYFESMRTHHGITPGIEHYATMIDLLGRAGHFTRVEGLLSDMPMQPDMAISLCLLGACRKHGKVALGKRAFDWAVQLQPQHAAAYVMLSSIYANAGLSDHAKEVEEVGQVAGAWKKPGQSWVEHEQAVHSFVVGDQSHLQQDQVYDLVGKVSLELKDNG